VWRRLCDDYLGGCFDPALVVIVDHLDRQMVVKLINKSAAEATAP